MKNENLEDSLLWEPTSKNRQFGYNSKRHWKFERCYGPAIRWLNSNVGRKWDDVWADICNAPKTDKKLHYIKEYIDNVVYINYFEKNGKIYTYIRYLEYEVENNDGHRFKEFYVHPTTQLLCKATYKPKPKPPQNNKVVSLNGLTYSQKNGIWYCVDLHSFSENKYAWSGNYDSLHKKYLSYGEAYYLYGKYVYCKSHRAIKNKELVSIKKHLHKSAK